MRPSAGDGPARRYDLFPRQIAYLTITLAHPGRRNKYRAIQVTPYPREFLPSAIPSISNWTARDMTVSLSSGGRSTATA